MTAFCLAWYSESDGVEAQLRRMARGRVALDCYAVAPMYCFIGDEATIADLMLGACRDRGWKLESVDKGGMVISRARLRGRSRIILYRGRQYEGLPADASCSILMTEESWAETFTSNTVTVRG